MSGGKRVSDISISMTLDSAAVTLEVLPTPNDLGKFVFEQY